MGFVARTIFWLGLVYSAMPLDFGSLISDRPPIPGDPRAACARGATEDCRQRLGELRKALDAAAALGIGDRIAAAAKTSAPADRLAPPRRSPQDGSN